MHVAISTDKTNYTNNVDGKPEGQSGQGLNTLSVFLLAFFLFPWATSQMFAPHF